jgi:hypothetical protein
MQDLSSGCPQAGHPFMFSRLTDLGNNHFTMLGGSDLNDKGVVAFSAAKASSQLTGIYTSNGKKVTPVVEADRLPSLFADAQIENAPADAPRAYSFGNGVEINNKGDVLFEAKLTLPDSRMYRSVVDRLFLKHGNTFTTVAETRGDQTPSSISNITTYTGFDLNDRDQVVYAIENRVISRYSNTRIYFNGQVIGSGDNYGGPIRSVYNPAINNQGAVFFAQQGIAFGTLTETQASNIFRLDPGATNPVPVGNQPLHVGSFAVNDAGTIIFSGSLSSGESGLFQIDANTIKNLGAPTATEFINNRGTIAFQPSQGYPGSGIYVHSGSKSTAVITPGDVLFGSTVSTVQLSGLNDKGQIAFTAQFSDGTVGIFRADPEKSKSNKKELTYVGADLIEA